MPELVLWVSLSLVPFLATVLVKTSKSVFWISISLVPVALALLYATLRHSLLAFVGTAILIGSVIAILSILHRAERNLEKPDKK